MSSSSSGTLRISVIGVHESCSLSNRLLECAHGGNRAPVVLAVPIYDSTALRGRSGPGSWIAMAKAWLRVARVCGLALVGTMVSIAAPAGADEGGGGHY